MTPAARQELHEWAERVRARKAREIDPANDREWTTADKTDLAVGGAVVVALIVCLIFGL